MKGRSVRGRSENDRNVRGRSERSRNESGREKKRKSVCVLPNARGWHEIRHEKTLRGREMIIGERMILETRNLSWPQAGSLLKNR